MQVDLSFLGSYSECLDISPEGVEPQFTGQYCLATFNLPDSAISTLQRISGLAASSLSNANTKLGLCVPSTCKMDEIKLITDKGKKIHQFQLRSNLLLKIFDCKFPIILANRNLFIC